LLSGNVIEWRMPEDIDIEGVEFKAMASGSHTLKTDFVYVHSLTLNKNIIMFCGLTEVTTDHSQPPQTVITN